MTGGFFQMTYKTRFQQEISGDLGEYWKRSAEAELEDLKKDIEVGDITIDEFGVARNRIGRVVMSDILEKLMYVAADRINEEATKTARKVEVTKSLEEYRKSMENHVYTEEELFEMRAAFGPGTIVTNIVTGQKVKI